MKYKVEMLNNGSVMEQAVVEASNPQQITRKALDLSKSYRNLKYVDLRVLNENGDIWEISAHILPLPNGVNEVNIFRNFNRNNVVHPSLVKGVFSGAIRIDDAVIETKKKEANC